MRITTLLIAVLLWGGCATKTVRPPAVAERPYLKLTANPPHRVTPGFVTITATIGGPIQWCPERVVFDFGDGSLGKRDLDCYDRIIRPLSGQNEPPGAHLYRWPGTYTIKVLIYSNEIIAGRASTTVTISASDSH